MIWACDRRQTAVEDLEDLESRERSLDELRDGKFVDVGPEWSERLKREIEALDLLIAANK
jgi:hypothetical protein